jgi:hypothetical protein
MRETIFYVRATGADRNDGLTPGSAWRTFRHAMRTLPRQVRDDERLIVDITGVDERDELEIALMTPSGPGNMDFCFTQSTVILAPLVVRAHPECFATLNVVTMQAEPAHELLMVVADNPGWREDEHQGRVLCGRIGAFFEHGTIMRNTSDTLWVASRGPFTPPLRILGPGARLCYGPGSTGLEYHPGVSIYACCQSFWYWVAFDRPDRANALRVEGAFNTGFLGCRVQGGEWRGRTMLDGCFIQGSWAFNGQAEISAMRSAFAGAAAHSHAGQVYMADCRFQECGPLGTGGTGHYAGHTQIEHCEHLLGTGHGYEVEGGGGRHTLRRSVISAAHGAAIQVRGPSRVVLDGVRGWGSDVGLRAQHGTYVEVRNDTFVEGRRHQIEGTVGGYRWADVPMTLPDGTRIHEPSTKATIMTPDRRDELESYLAEMESLRTAFYGRAIFCGTHAFIEFAGLMGEFIQICNAALEHGVDFAQANAHTGIALTMRDFQAKYLGEKFGCIFGAMFRKRPDLWDIFVSQVMGSKESPHCDETDTRSP